VRPTCGHTATETMPTDACPFLYDSAAAALGLNPSRETAVFCSYGTVPCPPIQKNGKCCGRDASVWRSHYRAGGTTWRSPAANSNGPRFG
jgi:hypothetical protein